MKLSVLERVTMQGMLATTGNYINLKIISELRERLAFTEAEHRLYGFEEQGTGMSWKKDVDQYNDISITPTELSIIVTTLRDMDAKCTLTSAHLSLYDKFVVGA